ncbi:MAG: choice-of-anchor L domain-containing protein [Myxococcota bacterium]
MSPHTLRNHGLRAVLASTATVVVLAGCEVRGVIGSNKSMDGDGGVLDAGDAAVTSDDGPSVDDGVDDGADDGDGVVDDADDGDAGDDAVFDVGSPDAGESCLAPLSSVCEREGNPVFALGINCGGFDGDVTFEGDPRAMYVHTGMLGTSEIYTPREGNQMVILSTGDATDIPLAPSELQDKHPAACVDNNENCPSQWLEPPVAPRPFLPAPMNKRAVSDDGTDCFEDPTLVGAGDCSNTIEAEFDAGDGWIDYAEIRIKADVPETADAFAFEFAFFTAEYPVFGGSKHSMSVWNDMYIAWLESENWTGNVSFDKGGQPITINSAFLDYRDASTESCMGCTAPQLAGFAAQHHAGTDWLRTLAPVTPNESIELIIAVMDMSDGNYDSAVLLDGFEWTCTDKPPLTLPAG